MKGYARHILTVFFSLTVALNVSAREVVAVNDTLTTEDEIVARVDSLGQEVEEEAKAFNPKETIFEHLGDEYGWNIVGRVTLPLPVIVRGIDGSWHVFSSTRLEDGKEYEGFYIAREGTHEGRLSPRTRRETCIVRMISLSRKTHFLS